MNRKTLVGMSFVLLTLVVGNLYLNTEVRNDPVSGGVLFGNSFDDWRPTNQTLINNGCDGCHDSGIAPGSGSLNLDLPDDPIYTLESFDVSSSVTGFVEAASDDIVVGFNVLDDDNSDFTTETVFENGVDVGGSGNSGTVTVGLTAPSTPGNYTLKAYAVWAQTGDVMYYLVGSVDVEVMQVMDTTPPDFAVTCVDSTTTAKPGLPLNVACVDNKGFENNTEVSGKVLIHTNVSDENIASVRYKIADDPLKDMLLDPSSGLYATEVNTILYPDGKTSMVIVATDLGGNQNSITLILNIQNAGQLPSTDIITYKVSNLISITDQAVDEIWEDISPTYIPEFGSGGYIKTTHNDFYIFALLAYDPSYTWVSIEFSALEGESNHMLDGHDTWSFMTDADYDGDGYFVGASGNPVPDSRQDLIYEKFEDTAEGLMIVEVLRPLDTNDPEGYDVVFNQTGVYNVQFASNVHHKSAHDVFTWALTDQGPSGGSQNTPPPPNGNSLSLTDVSNVVFTLTGVSIISIIIAHFAIRVKARPVDKPSRVVESRRDISEASLSKALRGND